LNPFIYIIISIQNFVVVLYVSGIPFFTDCNLSYLTVGMKFFFV
jgi:hypothetical protein